MADGVGVRDRIARVFSKDLNLDIPSVDADLFEIGVLDSLVFVELLVHLEREFGIKTSVEDLEIDNFRSIARIAEFVKNRASGSGRRRVANLGPRA